MHGKLFLLPATRNLQGHVSFSRDFIEDEERQDGSDGEDRCIGGSISVISPDDFRINGDRQCLGAVGV